MSSCAIRIACEHHHHMRPKRAGRAGRGVQCDNRNVQRPPADKQERLEIHRPHSSSNMAIRGLTYRSLDL